MSSLKEKLKSLPLKPGVYFFKDKNGSIIYIGKAKSLRKRVSSYFNKRSDFKVSILLDRLHDINYIVVGTELEALILEDQLVKQYKPRYNISLRDDKSYPFLKLTVNEKWPRLFLARKKQKDGALYFGRFQGGMVREAIRLVKKFFPIRWCKETPLRMRERPCLYYRIGACPGPCVGKISHRDYMLVVKGIASLLGGRMDQAIKKLTEEMGNASKQQAYERAAFLRDRITLLEKMIEGRNLSRSPSPKLLAGVEELQQVIGIKKIPMRIECFDISNIAGENIVGSMVTFYGGNPLKSDYRKFKIKSLANKPNDVAAIAEVVRRRYTGMLAKQLPQPDLVMVDGGIAQVNSAARALQVAKLTELPIIGLAKRAEEVFIYRKKRPLLLAKTSIALKLLQRIRDEAHRFAITYHRKKRGKALFK